MKREDAGAGCGWMRRFHAWVTPDPVDPALVRRRQFHFMGWMWGLFFLGMLATTTVDRLLLRSRVVTSGGTYVSAQRIAGWPLVAIGSRPRGIVAIGDFPVGVVALGGLPIGGIAVGGIALGGIAISGLSVGLFAIGGFALGWWALGGGALGHYALGGLAVGNYAYAGNGVAIGRYEALGRQKERLTG